jgi:hypothetical protein
MAGKNAQRISAGLLEEEKPARGLMKLKVSQKAVNAYCPVCKKGIKATRSWQKCCSRDCQLIFWHWQKFLEAYQAGKADGLKPIIEELKKTWTPFGLKFLESRRESGGPGL